MTKFHMHFTILHIHIKTFCLCYALVIKFYFLLVHFSLCVCAQYFSEIAEMLQHKHHTTNAYPNRFEMKLVFGVEQIQYDGAENRIDRIESNDVDCNIGCAPM